MYIEGCIEGVLTVTFPMLIMQCQLAFNCSTVLKVHDNLLATADEQFLGVCGKNMNFAIE